MNRCDLCGGHWLPTEPVKIGMMWLELCKNCRDLRKEESNGQT